MKKNKTARYILIFFVSIMVFFTFTAQTLNYIMTPKIITASVESGYISNEFSFNEISFFYEDIEKINIPSRLIAPFYVKNLNVTKGDLVHEGDVLLTFDTSEYLAQMESLHRDIKLAETELMEFDYKYHEKLNSLSKEREKCLEMLKYLNDGKEYRDPSLQSILLTLNQLESTISSQRSKLTELKTKNSLGIIPLEQVQDMEDELSKTVQKLEYNKKIFDQTKNALIQDYSEKIDSLETELKHLKQSGILNGQTREMLQSKLNELNTKLKDSPAITERFYYVTSPIQGIIDEVNINISDSYSGMKNLISVIPQHAVPLLKAKIPDDVIHKLNEGDECIIINNEKELRGAIKDKVNAAEEAYITIDLASYNHQDEIKNLDIYNTHVKVVKQSDYYNAIIPNSALIDESTVFLVKERTGFWGNELYIVKKQIIKGMSNDYKTAIVQGLTANDTVVVGWDRELSDGDTVSEYLE